MAIRETTLTTFLGAAFTQYVLNHWVIYTKGKCWFCSEYRHFHDVIRESLKHVNLFKDRQDDESINTAIWVLAQSGYLRTRDCDGCHPEVTLAVPHDAREEWRIGLERDKEEFSPRQLEGFDDFVKSLDLLRAKNCPQTERHRYPATFVSATY